MRSLAASLQIEIYWVCSAAPTATGASNGIGILTSPVYLIFCNTKNIFKLLFQLLTGNSNAPN
ncbi:hypothetical protein AM629_19900 [Photorhabdus heterorhabditis]|uniref:Uncharacterized protein n=1 Tax=Photorhabdus heterorhabditis TaxID=880156 RepID=A0ABR5K6U0_9GAMM|nr:hypothetical protein AM629_19900 [Photorhabdus heterorhabditis]